MPFTATYMKGRGNYLCLHRFESFREGAKSGHAPAVRRIRAADFSSHHRGMVEADGDRRPRRDRGPARGPSVLGRNRRDIRKLHRHRVPALHRLLRHAHAVARRRVESRRREPSPAVRRRGGPSERVRRSHPGVQLRHRRRSAPARRRGDAVFRRVREHVPVRRAGAGRRASDRDRRRRRERRRSCARRSTARKTGRTISSATWRAAFLRGRSSRPKTGFA